MIKTLLISTLFCITAHAGTVSVLPIEQPWLNKYAVVQNVAKQLELKVAVATAETPAPGESPIYMQFDENTKNM
jgi:hypothetical protein